MKKYLLWSYGTAAPLFIAGALLSNVSPAASCAVFFVLAVSQCVILYLQHRTLVDLSLLFSLSWILGIALAVLKLSELQAPWGIRMWSAVGIAFFALRIGRDLFDFLFRKRRGEKPQEEKALGAGPLITDPEAKRIFEAIFIVLVLALAALSMEAVRFHFEFPILSDKPHMYTEFHITGIHYLVVSTVLIPVMSVLFLYGRKAKGWQIVLLLFANLCSVVIPVLILSKLQLLFTFLLPFLLLLRVGSRKMRKTLLILTPVLLMVTAVAFVFFVKQRHYPDGYLQSIFCFKDPGTPIWFQYIYMYIVNNFENLNLLIENLESYSHGIRQLFPFFALTGLKFLPAVDQMLALEQYLTIPELTTVSFIYDAYGDFGLIGVGVMTFLVGGLNAFSNELLERRRIFGYLLYVQLACYMLFSFFTTWFSNATTWFYFIASFAIALYATRPDHRFRFSFREIFRPELKDRST